ncbi:MAG: Na(+)-translocating NADH-quinone reductase subunit A [Flavobacteriales bacterium]|nr:Na(+)-translocating NADH-quinone reductase subunit A [Flavobacteriales bacterium]
MPKNVKIRRGADIKLDGAAERIKGDIAFPSSFAIKPTDFHGLTPKMVLKEGAEVKAGQEIFHDKYNERVKFTSPVSGEIAEIVRGAKRRILEVRIVPDKDQKFESFDVSDTSSAEKVKQLLMSSGFWPMIKQRPYDVIANPESKPKSIFVSAFDSAPLAPDYDFILHGDKEAFQTGLNALGKLTDGKVHLNSRPGASADTVFAAANGVEKNTISGPHPAGNTGIQIHHIDPINKGELVWTVNAQSVAMIGRFLMTGKADFSKTIALAGSEVEKPRYMTTIIGASMKTLTDGQISAGDNRIISGNVLTGDNAGAEGYLGYYHDAVTVIPEGKEPQFLGWLAMNFNKFSLSRAYFSWMMPGKKFRLNTNQNGEDRAFVMSGQYESVLPMDIYPVHLIKAIMTNDIEKMEVLGIYEVAPEDLALCEYACTSKTPVQEILRGGLDLAQKELG